MPINKIRFQLYFKCFKILSEGFYRQSFYFLCTGDTAARGKGREGGVGTDQQQIQKPSRNMATCKLQTKEDHRSTQLEEI